MKKMKNGEKVIEMQKVVTAKVAVSRDHWIREYAPSWASNDEEGCTEVKEKYRRKHHMKQSVP